jgi:F-type H+-transporting ATPase subunit alpha
VAVIFSGVKGFINDLDVTKIKDFKKDLVGKIEREKPEIFKKIREKETIDADIENELKGVIEKLIKSYADTDGNKGN